MENLVEPVLSCMADGTRSTRTVADLQNLDVKAKEGILVFAKKQHQDCVCGAGRIRLSYRFLCLAHIFNVLTTPKLSRSCKSVPESGKDLIFIRNAPSVLCAH